MTGYSTRDVALMLEVPASRVYAYVRAGFLSPVRGARGGMRFTFQDLVLLRTARGLCDARVSPARVKRALRSLQQQLPEGRPLTAVTISAEGGRVVVRDGSRSWNPESGQALFNFSVRELERKVAPLAEALARKAREQPERDADEWFELGLDLEIGAPGEAFEAYRRAVSLDGTHADAWVNLGRLAHEAGRQVEAECCYRAALAARPGHALAAFNLGLALQERGRDEDALLAFHDAMTSDPACADAHYNASQIYERLGKPMAALRHLHTYKRLIDAKRDG
jgi:tetratricopeptide (TPR) repeat protein